MFPVFLGRGCVCFLVLVVGFVTDFCVCYFCL